MVVGFSRSPAIEAEEQINCLHTKNVVMRCWHGCSASKDKVKQDGFEGRMWTAQGRSTLTLHQWYQEMVGELSEFELAISCSTLCALCRLYHRALLLLLLPSLKLAYCEIYLSLFETITSDSYIMISQVLLKV